ncbi:MAG: excisionase family DNA-binding protein [Cellulomonadaceae bacterium]|jgi:excisionase family DNA binding protein|nr:excisionase family DNA-binding protein [Cellulomonadaceae bacterium]
MRQRLTTQQAADFLDINRPTLVKLLKDHQIAYEVPGTGRHRRLRLSDVSTTANAEKWSETFA